ncbi:hypothetical protein TcCL_ESM03081 [Trypanosoma cruzi]|uniref:Uncharacterized protein n=1 Tax=Trypanosoma cruzi (strain CL Brener) TaxID=353153 RepID=Q4CV88_TRYCC|nr:uncharacterized protein Tc00.1047053505073.20 [Trypanosoma cruzi]EAN84190.1 hypothetical protein Tc00.1047053505073.20 [Trypanosoma cruzi]RNC59276.1 hypothetical protein TcCL_ESM03081 [Trypanosoma cruzi]|eukprot:XP_806041.1 hypothetical protein Tc00.1047053505073.20 [Trypanosoma cruzi strain CL Brener]
MTVRLTHPYPSFYYYYSFALFPFYGFDFFNCTGHGDSSRQETARRTLVPMTTVPPCCVEPTPQLRMGVDYRWDPLFFRVPSPRGPRVDASRAAPAEREGGVLHVKEQQRTNERGGSTDMAPHLTGGTPRNQAITSPRVRWRRESTGDSGRGSPRMLRSEDFRGDRVLPCQKKIISPRTAIRPSSRSSSPWLSPATRNRRERSSPAVSRGRKARPATAGRATPLHSRGSSVALSSRLTRSAVLRREFNTSDKPEKQPPENFWGTADRMRLNTPRVSADFLDTRMEPKWGAGTFLPWSLVGIAAVPRHSQGQASAFARCDAPLTPRGTRAAALRVEHVRRKLNLDKLPAGSAARSRRFERTDDLGKTVLGAMDANCYGNGGGVGRRSELPPIPELWEIRMPHKATRIAQKRKEDTALDFGNGPNSSTNRILTAETQDHLPTEEAPTGETNGFHLGVDHIGGLFEEEGIASISSKVDSGSCATVMTGEVEGMQGWNALAEDHDAFHRKTGDEKIEQAILPAPSGSCRESGTTEGFCEEVKAASLPGVTADREGTLPPIDVVESLHEWTSDAFSEDTCVTPQSLDREIVEAVIDSPSYWREETLPMVERNATCSSPSEVSAEEDIPLPVNPRGRGEMDAPITGLPALSMTGGLSSISPLRRDLAERLALVRRHHLLEHAAFKRPKRTKRTSIGTLSKYKTLRRVVFMNTMRIFFHKWTAWTRVLAGTRSRLADQAALFTCGNEQTVMVPSAAVRERKYTICNESATSGREYVTHRRRTDVVREEPSAERHVKPTRPHLLLKEKSPPPLSQKLLEEACLGQWTAGSGNPSRPMEKDKESICSFTGTSFSSYASNTEAEACFSAGPCGAFADHRADGRSTTATPLEFPRPQTPVNCAVQEMERTSSHTLGASLNSGRNLSMDDSKGSIDIEGAIPSAKRDFSPLYKIKYLHSAL